MNKPITFVCACVAGLGLLILGRCTYLTVMYGHGDVGAGNWVCCNYTIRRDPVTGQVHRDWELRPDLEGTEAPVLPQFVDMWFIGFGLVVVGAGIYVAEQSSRDRARF